MTNSRHDLFIQKQHIYIYILAYAGPGLAMHILNSILLIGILDKSDK